MYYLLLISQFTFSTHMHIDAHECTNFSRMSFTRRAFLPVLPHLGAAHSLTAIRGPNDSQLLSLPLIEQLMHTQAELQQEGGGGKQMN